MTKEEGLQAAEVIVKKHVKTPIKDLYWLFIEPIEGEDGTRIGYPDDLKMRYGWDRSESEPFLGSYAPVV